MENSIRKLLFFIVENSNYSIEFLERTNIFEVFKISELVESKIQSKIDAQEAQHNKNNGIDFE